MKPNKIRISGKRVFENDDGLVKGCVEIELKIRDLLDEIDNECIEDYSRNNLGMRHENDFESDISDFDNDDLVKELKYNGYNFSREIGEEDCIEFLEESGYTVLDKNDVGSNLDYVDATMLDEIEKLFLTASCAERLEMYNKIFNL